jgi:hypothetical protein
MYGYIISMQQSTGAVAFPYGDKYEHVNCVLMNVLQMEGGGL